VLKLSEVRNNIMMILETHTFTRNFDNKSFYIFYECIIHKTVKVEDLQTDPESVRRCKQLLVEKYPYRYGPTDPVLRLKKMNKQVRITKMVVNNG
jgi:hypothetical protein